DDAQALWMSMPCGLARISRTEVNKWISNPAQSVAVTLFDTMDGICTPATPGGYLPTVAKAIDGSFWLTHTDGVTIFDPKAISANPHAIPVRIEQISVNHQLFWQNIAGAVPVLRLEPHLRDLQIDYTALSLGAPERTQFQYKLENHDRDWQ